MAFNQTNNTFFFSKVRVRLEFMVKISQHIYTYPYQFYDFLKEEFMLTYFATSYVIHIGTARKLT